MVSSTKSTLPSAGQMIAVLSSGVTLDGSLKKAVTKAVVNSPANAAVWRLRRLQMSVVKAQNRIKGKPSLAMGNPGVFMKSWWLMAKERGIAENDHAS